MTIYKTKKDAIAAASAVGLATDGTKANIEARIDAWEQAGHDTGEALYADANDLHPVAPGNTPATGGLPIHPVNALAIGGALGAVAHFLL